MSQQSCGHFLRSGDRRGTVWTYSHFHGVCSGTGEVRVYLSINHFIYTFTLSAFPDVRWEVVFTDNDTLLAYTNTTQLPLGLHTWHFEEGADCGNREVLISLHQH